MVWYEFLGRNVLHIFASTIIIHLIGLLACVKILLHFIPKLIIFR